MIVAKGRNERFTASALGNTFATSGSSTTTFVPSAYRRGYFPRTPPAKSYSCRISGSLDLRSVFFIHFLFPPGADDTDYRLDRCKQQPVMFFHGCLSVCSSIILR